MNTLTQIVYENEYNLLLKFTLDSFNLNYDSNLKSPCVIINFRLLVDPLILLNQYQELFNIKFENNGGNITWNHVQKGGNNGEHVTFYLSYKLRSK